jgi:hypothetical protein
MNRFQDMLVALEMNVRSYSGRGMYGANCLGIDVDRYSSIHRLAGIVMEYIADSFTDDGDNAADARELLLDAAEAFNNAKTDSMGLDSIIYFPNIPFEDDGSEDDSE